jgi:hypothetical protein
MSLLIVCMLTASRAARGADERARADEAYRIGIDAYVYAFPLVLMDVTKNLMTTAPAALALGAPVNQFSHVPNFPKAGERQIITPNVDTLFAMAWLDLSAEPIILHVPDTAGRYYLLPLLDAWSNVFTSVGKRTTGTKEADFGIVGPGWKGKLPPGVKEIKAPTNMVWIMGRVETNGPSDFPAVHALQKNIKLKPLSAFGQPDAPPEKTPGGPRATPKIDSMVPTLKQVESMDASTFFRRFAKLMVDNPPASADEKMIKRLAVLGIVPGKELDESAWDETIKKAVERAVKVGLNKVRTKPPAASRKLENGWLFERSSVGSYGTDYSNRAFTAQLSLGTNVRQDTIFPATKSDDKGKDLSGAHRYVLHFDKGQTPPVNGFWSVTLYDRDQCLVENPIKRYAIGDRNKLTYNEDGSLDILIQNESPGVKNKSNWLPAPRRDFNLIMRLYWPKEALLDGSWKIPPIKRVD